MIDMSNVIELQPAAESSRAWRACPCCGAGRIESDRGRAYNCNCEQKIYGSCEVCRYCLKHCRCTPRMKELRALAWEFYLERIKEIRGVFSENVNQREQ